MREKKSNISSSIKEEVIEEGLSTFLLLGPFETNSVAEGCSTKKGDKDHPPFELGNVFSNYNCPQLLNSDNFKYYTPNIYPLTIERNQYAPGEVYILNPSFPYGIKLNPYMIKIVSESPPPQIKYHPFNYECFYYLKEGLKYLSQLMTEVLQLPAYQFKATLRQASIHLKTLNEQLKSIPGKELCSQLSSSLSPIFGEVDTVLEYLNTLTMQEERVLQKYNKELVELTFNAKIGINNVIAHLDSSYIASTIKEISSYYLVPSAPYFVSMENYSAPNRQSNLNDKPPLVLYFNNASYSPQASLGR